MSSYDSIPQLNSTPPGLGTPRRKSRLGGAVNGNISSTNLLAGNSMGHDIFNSSRRSYNAIGGGRMDPSSAMLRIRTSMVGGENDGYDDNNDDNKHEKKMNMTYATASNTGDGLNTSSMSFSHALGQLPAIALIGMSSQNLLLFTMSKCWAF